MFDFDTLFPAIVISGALLVGGLGISQYFRRLAATRRIDDYRFPAWIARKVGKRYPELSPAQLDRVIEGLREYFHLTNQGAGRMIAMPSQVVDVAWHEMILATRDYRRFCREVLGRFLHHTPAEAMSGPTTAPDGIKRAWRLSCQREGIDPQTPKALPLLFAIDAELGIADGFHYELNCNPNDPGSYCASGIGCGGGCSGEGGGDGCGGGCGGD